MERPQVSIVMGSDSDLEIMKEALSVLESFGVPAEIQVLSAHRSPEKVSKYASELAKRGVSVVIAGASGAAHLAGVIAAYTILPVIGVPIPSALNGLDSLLATVQMPSGVPVATVAIGKAGATNAGILAVQILALNAKSLQKKLGDYKARLSDLVDQKNSRLQERLKTSELAS